ncbi:MAG: hypothetical protein AABX48_04395 [Nanoarchaeota archaeon]
MTDKMENTIQEGYNKLETGMRCGYYLGYASAIMSLRVRKLIPIEDASKILNELSGLYNRARKDAESQGIDIRNLPEDVPCNITEAINLESLMKKLMEKMEI